MGSNAEVLQHFRDILASSNKEDQQVLPALSLPDILQGEPDKTYDDNEGKLSNMLRG